MKYGYKFDEIGILAKYSGMDRSEIVHYRRISPDKAINRFLSKETIEEMVSNGDYILNPKDFMEKMKNAMTFTPAARTLEKYFMRSEGGKKWWLANVGTRKANLDILDTLKSMAIMDLDELQHAQALVANSLEHKRWRG